MQIETGLVVVVASGVASNTQQQPRKDVGGQWLFAKDMEEKDKSVLEEQRNR